MNNKEKILAVLSYVLIFALIPIFWRGKSAVLKTHVDSGIVVLFLWVLLLFVFNIPLIGIIAGALLLLACIISMGWGIYDAVRGVEADIPGVEKVAAVLN